MKRAVKMQDFWLYTAQIYEEVAQEVLEQVSEDEYLPCVKVISDYMFNLRAMHMDRIRAMNKNKNVYIPLINEALKKRNIFISECYIHISFC